MITSINGEQPMSAPFDVDSMTAEQRMTLGQMIKTWRGERNLSMLQLSDAAGVDRKTLRTIENGARAGQASKLKALLEALDIPQAGDFDTFSERTRAFILSAAPIFEQIPDAMQGEAQDDVVVLLMGKLQRSLGNVTHASFGGTWVPDAEREVASEGFEIDDNEDDHDWDA